MRAGELLGGGAAVAREAALSAETEKCQAVFNKLEAIFEQESQAIAAAEEAAKHELEVVIRTLQAELGGASEQELEALRGTILSLYEHVDEVAYRLEQSQIDDYVAQCASQNTISMEYGDEHWDNMDESFVRALCIASRATGLELKGFVGSLAGGSYFGVRPDSDVEQVVASFSADRDMRRRWQDEAIERTFGDGQDHP